MLPLSEIAHLQRTVDSRWCSPIADTIAAAWGYDPGSARYWRSSASHVFVILSEDQKQRIGYLRFVPAHLYAREQMLGPTQLMHNLAEAGSVAAAPLRSLAGNLLETIDVGGQLMHATFVASAAGETLEVDDLTAATARTWGTALGQLHRDAARVTNGVTNGVTSRVTSRVNLPDGRELMERTLLRFADDQQLGPAVATLNGKLETLSEAPGEYGPIHGDFELDNLAWNDDRVLAFDFDEAELSWYAADIAYALRDLAPEPQLLLFPWPVLIDAFVSGYQARCPQLTVTAESLLLFTAINALRSLGRLDRVLSESPDAGQTVTARATGVPLRDILESYAQRQRRLVIETTALIEGIRDDS